MKALCLVLWLLLAGAAEAETITVKSGEHDGFTRLVLELGAPAVWQMGRTADGYELRLAREGVRFDLSQVFERIPRDRLAAVWADPVTGALRIGLGCACHAMPFEFRPDIIVIDLRDGPPPAGSSFETAMSGQDLPALAARRHPRPRARPAGMQPGYDWTRSLLARGVPRSDGKPLAGDVLPDPDLAGIREDLLFELGRGATLGVVDLADPLLRRPEPGVTPKREETHAGPAGHVEMGFGPGVQTSTPGQIRPALTAQGRDCLPDDALDVGAWADARPFAEQIAEARAELVGQLDTPEPEAIARYVRLNLHFGFGAEARSVQRSMRVVLPEAALWEAMAQIVDEGSARPGGPLADQEACDTAAALWSVLARPDLRRSDRPDLHAVLRSFSALPVHLRRHLGPGLAERFLAVGDTATVRAVRDAMRRAPGEPGAGAALLDARMDLAQGRVEDAGTGFAKVVRDGGPQSAQALIDLVDLRVAQGIAIDADMILALAALAHEQRAAPLGPALNRAEMLARASAGEFDQAFAMAADADPADAAGVWALLAHAGSNSALLTHAVLPQTTALPPVGAEIRAALATRLIEFGFADTALHWLQSPDGDPARTLLAARAELGRRDARAALRLLAGRADPEAEALRALAQTQLGNAAEAARAFAAAGNAVDAQRANWWGRNWPQVALSGTGAQQTAAAELAPEVLPMVTLPGGPASTGSQGGLPDAPLAQGRDLIRESARTRTAILALLQSVPGPDANQP